MRNDFVGLGTASGMIGELAYGADSNALTFSNSAWVVGSSIVRAIVVLDGLGDDVSAVDVVVEKLVAPEMFGDEC